MEYLQVSTLWHAPVLNRDGAPICCHLLWGTQLELAEPVCCPLQLMTSCQLHQLCDKTTRLLGC